MKGQYMNTFATIIHAHTHTRFREVTPHIVRI